MSEDIKAVVHVIDDDESIRKALAHLLGAAGFEVRTYTGAGDFLLHQCDSSPGCILLDVSMPGGPSGVELQRVLSQQADALPVVFLTGHADIGMGVAAMKAGAVDFLTKPVDRDALLGAVDAAIARDRARREALAQDRELRAHFDALTPRERQVFAAVTAGRLNKQIAFDMGASERTIKAHRAHVMEKFQARSFVDLIKIATRLEAG